MKMIHHASHRKLLSCFLTADLGVLSTKNTGEKQQFHCNCACSILVAGLPRVPNLSWQVNPCCGSENSCGSHVFKQIRMCSHCNGVQSNFYEFRALCFANAMDMTARFILYHNSHRPYCEIPKVGIHILIYMMVG